MTSVGLQNTFVAEIWELEIITNNVDESDDNQ